MVRAILSGIWTPAEAGPDAPMAPVPPLEGMVDLDSANRVLPELIARSSATRSPLSLVLVRPGKAGDSRPAPPGGIADLAAALTVSLAPSQQLLQAGPGHLAVAVTGGPRAARRHAQRLMARAALAGAPVLTWAMASYPRDGSSSAALIQTATGRLQLPARTGAAAAGHGRGALWAGVAAAALVGVVAYTVGSGHGPKNPSASSAVAESGQSALSAAGGSAPSSATSTGGQPGAVQTSVPPAWIGGSQSGTSGSSTAGGSASGTGSGSASGTSGVAGGGEGTSSVTPSGTGGGQQQSTGTGTNGTISGVTTTIPGVTTTTVAGSGTTGGTTSGGTTSGSGTTGSTSGTTTGGTNNKCTGLLQSLLCTVNGLLG